jgi:hypothetical protein
MSVAERALFSDLTRLFMSLRQAPHSQLEASVEERFRQFVRANGKQDVGGLQITFTWMLPEGPDEWAVYATEYKTLPVENPMEHRRAVGGGPAEVLAFSPAPAHDRTVIAPGQSAEIITFPGC